MNRRELRVEATLARLTWRLLLGRRRWIWLVVANALPPLLVLLFLAQQGPLGSAKAVRFAGGLIGALVLTVLLPLAGLVHGTTALGHEIEDGTLAYLLAKPIARWRLVAAKTLVAAAATALSVVPGVLVSLWLVTGAPLGALARGCVVGIAAASALYAAVFVALSLVTRRALLIGIVYIVAWEGALSRLFGSLRALSIRELATSVAQQVAGTRLPGPFASPLDPSTAVWAGAVILALALWLAVVRLRGIELAEEV